MGDEVLSGFSNGIKSQVDGTVPQSLSHPAYVEQYCKALPMGASVG